MRTAGRETQQRQVLSAWRRRGHADGFAGKPMGDGRAAAAARGGEEAASAYAGGWRSGRNRRLR